MELSRLLELGTRISEGNLFVSPPQFQGGLNVAQQITKVQKNDTAPQQADWAAIARNPKFVEIHHKKTVFLFGWWIFSTVYYFLLPIGAGAAPGLFSVKVIGNINFGYLFALSQFFVSWGIAMYYASWATRVSDRLTSELLDELKLK
ncbi:MAG: DUF485 domain-containing protein [Desulfomonile tiedjei]|uniref:DUF485 domain-containing protein n=1 Tax=Desulfomonile tiedjei TaxID=2358 RepID=A0A9D6V6H9_9BACT|nr:DUF485 domain-containing protein [Desulfomonile tiedjei]